MRAFKNALYTMILLPNSKEIIRKKIINKRNGLSKIFINNTSLKIKEKILSHIEPKNLNNILIYVSKEKEVNTIGLIRELLTKGKNVFVPYIDANKNILGISKIKSYQELKIGSFKILEPKEEFLRPSLIKDIDVIIIPGIAFDQRGNRIGYGWGYFDKLLEGSNALKIGIGYDFQIVDNVKQENHDIEMDLIITDKREINPKKDNDKGIIMDGSKIAERIEKTLKMQIAFLKNKPCLAVILVGDNPASRVYVTRKKIVCEKVGIISKNINLDENVSEQELFNIIDNLNKDKNINGILVQLPLPKHINEKEVISRINALKDVDGFNPLNVGSLAIGKKTLTPCTPKGIIRLLENYKILIESKDVTIIGRSNIVGKPLIQLFLDKNATVTVCHSRTKDLEEKTKRADILVVAAGKANLITKEMIKEKAIIIDVGVNRIKDNTKKSNYRICGDVDFDNVREKCSYISPVPGGVGPMTVAMLLENTLEAYKIQRGLL